ncbi:MAG: hypothetical protein CMJ78_21035 [Planctomycetaceae bacterium]|nr:hypothetical protein [Planctomycetaceae bacterium]
MTYLSDIHNIPILIDEQSLAEDGIDPDEPIDLFLSGIRLESVLRRILDPLALEFVIEHDAMTITTSEAARGK